MGFELHEKVEVCSKSGAIAGMVYTATVVRRPIVDPFLYLYWVRYVKRFRADGNQLAEFVHVGDLRPMYPRERSFQDFAFPNYAVGERVEVLQVEPEQVPAPDARVWWIGTVTRRVRRDGLRFLYVQYDCNGKIMGPFGFFRTRRHLQWRNGEWISPERSDQSNQASTSASNQASTSAQEDPESEGNI